MAGYQMDETRFLSSIAKRKYPHDETVRMLSAPRKEGVISLNLGEPDFAPPQFLFDGLDAAGKKGYGPPIGMPGLREGIARKLKSSNGIDASMENIAVTCGATEALFLSAMASLNPKDEVILPEPCFSVMKGMFEVFGASVIDLPLKQDEQFEVNPDELAKQVGEKTKCIYLNSPSNPTGAILSRKILEEIADIAVDRDLFVISDEAYESLVYEGEHVSIASLNGMFDRTILVYTLSKTWAMPGFRLGYMCAPDFIIQAAAKLHLYTTVCAPLFSQALGLRVLEKADSMRLFLSEAKKEYEKRRDFITYRLNEAGLWTHKPKGAFYAFSDIRQFSKTSSDFSKALLEEANVLAMPGSDFGPSGEGFMRFSYAASMKNIEDAMDRIDAFARKNKSFSKNA